MKHKTTFVATLMLVVMFLQLLPASSVAAANYCDWVQFVSDVTVADGTVFAPGATFTKTWRLKNIGSCTWTTSYNLLFVSGDQMGTTNQVALPNNVAPGQIVDVSVNLTAPSAAGHYRGYWQLKNASGRAFGLGWGANQSFWVDINVSSSGGTTNGVAYDFAANASAATWSSGAGTLPFPGTDGDSRGFGKTVDSPQLEDGSANSAQGILVAPQNIYNGFVQAQYPSFLVQSGDHFQSIVNCQYGASACYVNFQLDYQIDNGPVRIFWSFNEKDEGWYYNVDLDLSSLAGQNVKFILRLGAAGYASGDRALWVGPRITRAGATSSPTPTPAVTGTPPTPTALPPVSFGCDRAVFISDVSVPDGTVFAPGATFAKTWRLKNTGSCTWTTSYSLVFVSGDQMGGPDSVPMPNSVAPGQTVDLTVNLTAPSSAGSYRGYWQFKNASGALFGIGFGANKPFWVDIKVSGSTSGGGTGYDFAANACSATWISGAGTLPCPGTDGDSRGFVLQLSQVTPETGSVDSRATLLTAPQNVYNGYIQGIYPAFTVQSGDRFQATVGCQYGATNCYVTYRLDYQIDSGPVHTFWYFSERYDGLVYNADLSLDSLAGQNVKFILTVLSAGYANGDRALWIAPHIFRPGASSATATPTPAATLTPTVTGTGSDASPSATPTVASSTATSTPAPTATSSGTDLSNWNTYQDVKYNFQFKFPPGSSISSQSDNAGRVSLPFAPGTNLVEKYIDVSVADNATTCSSPAGAGNSAVTSQNVTINNIQFLQETGSDAGAGQFHDWVGYSTTKDTACISLTFVLHSTDPGNYTTPPPTYDKTAESSVFETIISTFGWIGQ